LRGGPRAPDANPGWATTAVTPRGKPPRRREVFEIWNCILYSSVNCLICRESDRTRDDDNLPQGTFGNAIECRRLDRQGYYSGLRKTSVACKTCDVSESFYSSTSIKRFALEHIGHEVVEWKDGTPTPSPLTEPPNARQDGKVRLLKVMVELVMLPAYPSPVFTITGVKEDLKSAFVQVVSPSQRDQVRETLEKGKYLDSGSSDTVYVWEPKSISFSEDANLAMSFGSSPPVGPDPAERGPSPEEPHTSDDQSTSGKGHEMQIAASEGEQSAVAVTEHASQAETPVLLALPRPGDSAAPPLSDSAQIEDPSPPSARGDAAEETARQPAEPGAPSIDSREDPTPIASDGKEVAATGPSQVSHGQEVEEESYLLVSRSWYIEKGPKNMEEAIRISRILRPFRWRIEPAYTIGVILDDILSVESANGEIGGDVAREVEGAGYKLSRVSVEKGKPVAWFKREPASERKATGS
jgi:hypothetical protein